MSFLKLGENLREQVSIFIENVRRIEGIEKIINLTAEKFLTVSKDPEFESKLAEFFTKNFQSHTSEESNYTNRSNLKYRKIIYRRFKRKN